MSQAVPSSRRKSVGNSAEFIRHESSMQTRRTATGQRALKEIQNQEGLGLVHARSNEQAQITKEARERNRRTMGHGKSAPQVATEELVQQYRQQAQLFADVSGDQERILAFCAWRIKGEDIPTARSLCKMGLIGLQVMGGQGGSAAGSMRPRDENAAATETGEV